MVGNAEKRKVTYSEPQKLFLEKFEKIENILIEGKIPYGIAKMEIGNGELASFNQSVPERSDNNHVTLFKFETKPRKIVSMLARREVTKEEMVAVGQLYLKDLAQGQNRIGVEVYGKENVDAMKEVAGQISAEIGVDVDIKLRRDYGIKLGLSGPGVFYVPEDEKKIKRA